MQEGLTKFLEFFSPLLSLVLILYTGLFISSGLQRVSCMIDNTLNFYLHSVKLYHLPYLLTQFCLLCAYYVQFGYELFKA